ncbi:hypothetical protein HAX54_004482 [Datura stramonium]|uniref:Uncharacterized protein n=1 Tax=Datura stramonium TaxID=4076 RepID=A0ABS8T7R9_DATST|nr:hypothetical protein [Datura stramonium]
MSCDTYDSGFDIRQLDYGPSVILARSRLFSLRATEMVTCHQASDGLSLRLPPRPRFSVPLLRSTEWMTFKPNGGDEGPSPVSSDANDPEISDF